MIRGTVTFSNCRRYVSIICFASVACGKSKHFYTRLGHCVSLLIVIELVENAMKNMSDGYYCARKKD